MAGPDQEGIDPNVPPGRTGGKRAAPDEPPASTPRRQSARLARHKNRRRVSFAPDTELTLVRLFQKDELANSPQQGTVDDDYFAIDPVPEDGHTREDTGSGRVLEDSFDADDEAREGCEGEADLEDDGEGSHSPGHDANAEASMEVSMELSMELTESWAVEGAGGDREDAGTRRASGITECVPTLGDLLDEGEEGALTEASRPGEPTDLLEAAGASGALWVETASEAPAAEPAPVAPTGEPAAAEGTQDQPPAPAPPPAVSPTSPAARTLPSPRSPTTSGPAGLPPPAGSATPTLDGFQPAGSPLSAVPSTSSSGGVGASKWGFVPGGEDTMDLDFGQRGRDLMGDRTFRHLYADSTSGTLGGGLLGDDDSDGIPLGGILESAITSPLAPLASPLAAGSPPSSPPAPGADSPPASSPAPAAPLATPPAGSPPGSTALASSPGRASPAADEAPQPSPAPSGPDWSAPAFLPPWMEGSKGKRDQHDLDNQESGISAQPTPASPQSPPGPPAISQVPASSPAAPLLAATSPPAAPPAAAASSPAPPSASSHPALVGAGQETPQSSASRSSLRGGQGYPSVSGPDRRQSVGSARSRRFSFSGAGYGRRSLGGDPVYDRGFSFGDDVNDRRLSLADATGRLLDEGEDATAPGALARGWGAAGIEPIAEASRGVESPPGSAGGSPPRIVESPAGSLPRTVGGCTDALLRTGGATEALLRTGGATEALLRTGGTTDAPRGVGSLALGASPPPSALRNDTTALLSPAAATIAALAAAASPLGSLRARWGSGSGSGPSGLGSGAEVAPETPRAAPLLVAEPGPTPLSERRRTRSSTQAAATTTTTGHGAATAASPAATPAGHAAPRASPRLAPRSAPRSTPRLGSRRPPAPAGSAQRATPAAGAAATRTPGSATRLFGAAIDPSLGDAAAGGGGPLTFSDFCRLVDVSFLDNFRRGGSISYADVSGGRAADAAPRSLAEAYRRVAILSPRVAELSQGIRTLQAEVASRRSAAAEAEQAAGQKNPRALREAGLWAWRERLALEAGDEGAAAHAAREGEALRAACGELRRAARARAQALLKDVRGQMEASRGARLGRAKEALAADLEAVRARATEVGELAAAAERAAAEAAAGRTARREAARARADAAAELTATRASTSQARDANAERRRALERAEEEVRELARRHGEEAARRARAEAGEADVGHGEGRPEGDADAGVGVGAEAALSDAALAFAVGGWRVRAAGPGEVALSAARGAVGIRIRAGPSPSVQLTVPGPSADAGGGAGAPGGRAECERADLVRRLLGAEPGEPLLLPLPAEAPARAALLHSLAWRIADASALAGEVARLRLAAPRLVRIEGVEPRGLTLVFLSVAASGPALVRLRVALDRPHPEPKAVVAPGADAAARQRLLHRVLRASDRGGADGDAPAATLTSIAKAFGAELDRLAAEAARPGRLAVEAAGPSASVPGGGFGLANPLFAAAGASVA